MTNATVATIMRLTPERTKVVRGRGPMTTTVPLRHSPHDRGTHSTDRADDDATTGVADNFTE